MQSSKYQKKGTKNFLFVILNEFSSNLLTGFSITPHMFCRRENCNRNFVVKLHCWNTALSISFTLKILRLYRNKKRFCLGGIEKLYSDERTYSCYLIRSDKLARGQCVEIRVGWTKRGLNRINWNGSFIWCSVHFGWIFNSFCVRPAAFTVARAELKQKFSFFSTSVNIH